MRIKYQEDILDPTWRKGFIKSVDSNENQARKIEAKKRNSIYKDNTKEWVIKALAEEFSDTTVKVMANRAANVSIVKKVIKKLAQVYQNGAIRTVDNESDQITIDSYTDALDMDTFMKKVNRYVELFKNVLVQIVPQSTPDESTDEKEVFDIKMRALNPSCYDPILDYRDEDLARGYVLSEVVEKPIENELYSHQRNDKFVNYPNETFNAKDNRQFIFWTDKYHFTTDSEGQIIDDLSPEGNLNPIKKLPFINISEDTDGSFFAHGGQDLIDGAVLINVLLTDMFAIANQQGWGQPVVTGKNLPKKIETGPHNAIILEHEAGDPQPDFKYASSNPPINDWMAMIEQYTALILSTNNLSPSNVASKLDATNFASGIALLIEKSEASIDIEDKQNLFRDKEPKIWEVIKLWIDMLFSKKALSERLTTIGTFTDYYVSLAFPKVRQVVTESERLDMLEKRKALGINTEIEILMLDNPDLTEDEAEKKLLEIKKENMEKLASFMSNAIEPKEEKEVNDGGEESEV